MSATKQIAAITAMNLRTIPLRLGSSLVVCIGIAGVVAVLITVLAMSSGLAQTVTGAARDDRAIVLRSGATFESLSTVTRDGMLAIEAAPGVARAPDGTPAVSPEVLLSVNLARASDGELVAELIRGITSQAMVVRPEIALVEGRMFAPGLRELVVGVHARETFRDLNLGGQVSFHGGAWKVVGVFTSNGDAHESEVLVDANTLMSAAQRTVFNAATVQLASTADFDAFKAALETNPLLKVAAKRETEYYAAQAKDVSQLLELVANVVGAIMALGALFGALNTMYSAVSARTVEICTLRAIGFGGTAVVISVLVEALMLALLGALGGAAMAWLLFNGNAFSTGGTLSQVSLHLQIGPRLVVTGIVWASVIGLIGGLFPALRAARLPVAMGLRVV